MELTKSFDGLEMHDFLRKLGVHLKHESEEQSAVEKIDKFELKEENYFDLSAD
jgi:hypothetical protein